MKKIYFFCRIFTMLKEHPKVLNRKEGKVAGDNGLKKGGQCFFCSQV